MMNYVCFLPQNSSAGLLETPKAIKTKGQMRAVMQVVAV